MLEEDKNLRILDAAWQFRALFSASGFRLFRVWFFSCLEAPNKKAHQSRAKQFEAEKNLGIYQQLPLGSRVLAFQ